MRQGKLGVSDWCKFRLSRFNQPLTPSVAIVEEVSQSGNKTIEAYNGGSTGAIRPLLVSSCAPYRTLRFIPFTTGAEYAPSIKANLCDEMQRAAATDDSATMYEAITDF